MSLFRSVRAEIHHQWSSGNIIMRLILINAVVFIAVNLVYVSSFFYYADRVKAAYFLHTVLEWLGISPSLKKVVARPWVIITHMFTHVQFFHFLFNMLGLYWFGNIVSEFIGNRKILPLYLMGGLAGALVLLVFYYLFPSLHPAGVAVGASAAILAIIMAAATIVPDYEVFLFLLGPIKIKWIAVVLLVIDLISIPEHNSGGHLAHLGGALLGYLYIKQLQAGTDLASPWLKLYERLTARLQPRTEVRRSYKHTTVPSSTRASSAANRSSNLMSKQERIDAILDKISHSGYDSLSQEEKEFLFKVAKED